MRTWLDMVNLLSDDSKDVLFKDTALAGRPPAIVACIYIRVPDSYDHAPAHNAAAYGALYNSLKEEASTAHAGFGLIRDDGTMLFLKPKWNSADIEARWYGQDT